MFFYGAGCQHTLRSRADSVECCSQRPRLYCARICVSGVVSSARSSLALRDAGGRHSRCVLAFALEARASQGIVLDVISLGIVVILIFLGLGAIHAPEVAKLYGMYAVKTLGHTGPGDTISLGLAGPSEARAG